MKKQKIVLANSVGIDENEMAIIHSPSRWSNSSKDKKVFTYYPWELAYTSTLLKRETDHDVKLIDGCLMKYNHDQYLKVLLDEDPDYLVMEPSTRTWKDDKRLAVAVRELCGAKIIMVGQHASAQPEVVKEVADDVGIGEFEMTLLEFFHGFDPKDMLGIYPNKQRPLLDIDYLPWPEDEDVSRLHYAYPGEPSSEYVEIQTYATRGCPMNCSYCVCRHVYYAKQNWRARSPLDVVNEVRYLKEKYPEMEGIFFDEEFHNVSKKYMLALTGEIKRQNMQHIKYDAMCAYLSLDREVMEAMKSAGYYMIRFGIETADAEIAKSIDLGAKYNPKKLWEVVKIAKDLDIKLYGTFQFGSAGSSFEKDMKTYELLEELVNGNYLWRFQTSICTPQPGTPYYKWAEEKGFLSSDNTSDYDGGNTAVMNYPHYSNDKIEQLYSKAQAIYDIGLKKRFESGIYQSVQTLKEYLAEGEKKILLLRTTRTEQYLVAFEALKQLNSGLQLDALVQDSLRDEFEESSLIRKVKTYGDGFFDLQGLSPLLLEELREEDYDLVVMIYANTQGRDYDNVIEAAGSFHGRKLIAMTSRGDIIELANRIDANEVVLK